MDQTESEFLSEPRSQKNSWPLASSLLAAFGIGCVVSQFLKFKPEKSRKINQVDERLRKALHDEDQKTTVFPKNVDLAPAFD